MSFRLSSPAFRDGQAIPARHTGLGEDISPALAWSDPPDRTRSFALICDAPAAPGGTWTHWVIYNLPTATRGLAEGLPPLPALPDGSRQGTNSFGRPGYGGPHPPRGPVHRYFFTLYALDRAVALPAGATAGQCRSAMAGAVLASTQLLGLFRR